MAVTLRDALDLEILKGFKVVAGKNGLSKTITSTEILDFEFVLEGQNYREKVFDGDSLVVSSLLFAKDDPSLILDTTRLSPSKTFSL